MLALQIGNGTSFMPERCSCGTSGIGLLTERLRHWSAGRTVLCTLCLSSICPQASPLKAAVLGVNERDKHGLGSTTVCALLILQIQSEPMPLCLHCNHGRPASTLNSHGACYKPQRARATLAQWWIHACFHSIDTLRLSLTLETLFEARAKST